jgi:putative hemolysin
MANQAAADGVVTPRERALVLNSLTIGLRTARQIMVPRVKVAFLDVRRSMDENLEVTNQYLFNRIPLCDGGLDNVLGVVRTTEFLAAHYAGGDSSVLPLIGVPPVFVPESATLDKLLETFHERRTQLAFAVDEYGGVEGVVTLRDVFDELLGEDAGTTAPRRKATPELASPESVDAVEGELAVPGDTPLHELASRLHLADWPARRRPKPITAVTVGGLLVTHFQHVPRPGEEAEIDGVRLRVLDSDRRAVKRVAVRVEVNSPG